MNITQIVSICAVALTIITMIISAIFGVKLKLSTKSIQIELLRHKKVLEDKHNLQNVITEGEKKYVFTKLIDSKPKKEVKPKLSKAEKKLKKMFPGT